MTLSAAERERLDLLLSALRDDALGDDQAAELERIVCGRPEAMHHYLRVVNLTVGLRWLAETVEDDAPAVEREPESPEIDLTLPQDVVVRPASRRFAAASDFSIEGLIFSYAVASVVLCLILLSAWAYKIDRGAEIARTDSPPSPAVEKPRVVFVGRITGMVDCEWSGAGVEPFVGAHIPLGQKFVLSSGLAEITYDAKTKVILEGPCEYEVDSRRSGYLAIGKLTARVEAGDGKSGNRSVGDSGRRGFGESDNRENHPTASTSPVPLFAVRTPTAVVTDLGTEFGVEVDNKGATRTQVLAGIVRLRTVAVVDGASAERVLSAGETGVVTSGVAEITVADAGRSMPFVRVMPSLIELRKAEADAYAKLVMSLGPIAYYRMERPENEKDILTVFDSAPGGRHGKLSIVGGAGGSERLWCMGQFGGALRFRGEFFGDYVVAPRTPDSDSNQYSLSIWLIADSREFWSQAFEEGGGRGLYRHKLTMREYDDDLSGRTFSAQGEIKGVLAPHFPLNQWQHIAFVVDGNALHMYRNGDRTQSTPCTGVIASPPGKFLLIGCGNRRTADGQEELSPVCFWDGQIDEVAVFHRALSEKEVKQLFEGPTTSPRAGRGPTSESKTSNE